MKIERIDLRKKLVQNLPYLLIGLYATKLSQAWRLAAGNDASEKLLHYPTGLEDVFRSPLPSFNARDLLFGAAVGLLLALVVLEKRRNRKKLRKGTEYGSARWGTARDIAPYIDPKPENNLILTRTERLTMNNRPKDPKTARNKNVLVIGGSGSGKTRFFITPNLLQCDSVDYPCSFVVTDPKGGLIVNCGSLLQQKGYRIKVLNLINFQKSMKYNPLAYLHSEKDILKLVNVLMENTKGEGKGTDPFWEKSERLLLTALIAYLHYECSPQEQNFSSLLDMLGSMQVREDDEDFQNPVDLLFADLERNAPDHFAVRQYKTFKLAAGDVCSK